MARLGLTLTVAQIQCVSAADDASYREPPLCINADADRYDNRVYPDDDTLTEN